MYTAYGTAYNSLVHVGEMLEMIKRIKHSGRDKLRLFIHGASGGVGVACIQVRLFLLS